jgi:IclR family pca regulon transcriptional regulator
VLDHDQLVCVAAVSAGQLVSTTLQPGTRVPAWCTANGRILLANLPPAQLDAILARPAGGHHRPYHHRCRTIGAGNRPCPRQGYALVDQELELGLRTMAVPVRNFRGEVVAAMNISVHAARMKLEDMVERCLPAMLKIQVELGALL